jgi:hypothetical protein
VNAVAGIDLSSRAIDLVRLDETQPVATHRRVSLEAAGKTSTAWERTLLLPALMPRSSWWDDVYLVAIEAPYGVGPGTVAVLNRVVGAIAASLPARLRVPERCWIVRPDEWKQWLGVPASAKPTADDVYRLGLRLTGDWPDTQDARDALCVAYWAREINASALAASA